MAQREREARSLVTAVALHGAVLLAIAFWASHQPVVAGGASFSGVQQASCEDEFDVGWVASEMVTSASAVSPRDPSVRRQTLLSPQTPSVSLQRSPAAREESTKMARSAGLPAPRQEEQALRVSPSTSALPPVDLGLGSDGWQRWLPATRVEAPVPSPQRSVGRPLFRMPAPSSNGGLREGLEAHDRALGLGGAGTVVNALFNAAHGALAPATGLARFQVTVLKSGAVEVSLRDATHELSGWRAVAGEAASRLRKAPPSIALERKGVRWLIEIAAENVLPNGVKQKQLSAPHGEVRLPRLRSITEAQKALKDLNPVAGQNGVPTSGSPAISDLPGVFLAQQGTVCGYRIGLSLLGPMLQGGCDPSNIGAKPQRMVHTRVAEETPF